MTQFTQASRKGRGSGVTQLTSFRSALAVLPPTQARACLVAIAESRDLCPSRSLESPAVLGAILSTWENTEDAALISSRVCRTSHNN